MMTEMNSEDGPTMYLSYMGKYCDMSLILQDLDQPYISYNNNIMSRSGSDSH